MAAPLPPSYYLRFLQTCGFRLWWTHAVITIASRSTKKKNEYGKRLTKTRRTSLYILGKLIGVDLIRANARRSSARNS